MDPAATTSAAAAHGHLITLTRRPFLPASAPAPTPAPAPACASASPPASASASPPPPASGADNVCRVSDAQPEVDASTAASIAAAAAAHDPDLELELDLNTLTLPRPPPPPPPPPPLLPGAADSASCSPLLPPSPHSLTRSASSFASTSASISTHAYASVYASPSPPWSASPVPVADALIPSPPPCLETLPSEMLVLVLGFLDVDDVFHLSRTCHRLRSLCLDPIIQLYRLRNARLILGPLLTSPSRPTLPDLISRFIFQTNNTVISRRLARSLVSIRLSRRLAQRPSADTLAQRAVLPRECVPGLTPVLVAPALVAKRKAIEMERLKDSLRRWIAGKWCGEVKEREADVRRHDEALGIGRVWKLRRFWEKVSRGELAAQ